MRRASAPKLVVPGLLAVVAFTAAPLCEDDEADDASEPRSRENEWYAVADIAAWEAEAALRVPWVLGPDCSSFRASPSPSPSRLRRCGRWLPTS